MMRLSIEDLARVSFPDRGNAGGVFAMLEFYYDDSGTHNGSDVVVWGGVTGYKEVMDDLDKAWRARLARPTGNRPPLSKFHLYDLVHGLNEFSGYSDGEKDRVRRNFRKCIVDSGACVLAYAISRVDWDAIATPAAKLLLGSAERMIFGMAVMASCKIAMNEGQPLSFIFDKGRRPDLDSILMPAIEASDVNQGIVGYGFQPVVSVMGLQAADLVAYEAYRFGCDYLLNQDAEPNIHMQRLLEEAHDQRIGWVGSEQIQSMIDGTSEMFAQLGIE